MRIGAAECFDNVHTVVEASPGHLYDQEQTKDQFVKQCHESQDT